MASEVLTYDKSELRSITRAFNSSTVQTTARFRLIFSLISAIVRIFNSSQGHTVQSGVTGHWSVISCQLFWSSIPIAFHSSTLSLTESA